MTIKGKNNLDKTSAAPVLAGFRYQLLQTLIALMSLRSDEILVLEVSQDFSVLSVEASTDFQVKHSQAASGPTPHSLQSSDVIKLLARFWTSAQSPEGDQKRLVFLARGGAALERDLKFPDKIPGLKYWAAAATDADPTPIRSALLETHKDTLLGEWLRTYPSDEEFRARLLTRVSWQLDLKPAESLVAQLRQQASSFYFDRKLPVSAAKQAIDSLLALAIEVASRPDIDSRKLSVIDLHTTLETAAGTNLVAQQMLGVQALTPATSSHDIFIAEADVASIASHRVVTVTDCLTKVAGLPLAWVHGAHGVGKSILARLMAHRTGGRWIALDLWPVRNDPTGALGAWREMLRAFDQGIRPKGIIIDDFSADSATALKLLLTALTQTMQAWGGRVIVTSHHAPSPAHMLEFSSSANGIIQAPYFSESDIADLVRVAPAPDESMVKSWIAMISLTTGGGQPLLVAAKVASLRARDWPAEALLEDFGTPSEAIRLTKEEQRRKLVGELNQLDQARSLEAGQLLRRIACIFDRVDESLAMGLVKAAPALPNGGDALAVLRGSWLESLPKGDFRVSPLIADITTDVPAEQAKEWRRFAAEYWLSQKTLDQRTLPLCFWNAFTGEHDWVLLKICEIILSMEREKRRGVAPILSPLTAFSTDKRLYAPHELIGVHLRLLQFDIADALGEKETAGKAAVRLFVELDQLENDDARVLLTMLAVPKVLMAPDASISPHLRLECALRVRSNLERARVLFEGHVPAADTLLPPWFKPEWDFADFLFSMILPHLQDSQAELEAFEALSTLEENVRNRFIDSMSSTYGMSVFANAGWANEQVSNRASNETLSRYVKICEIVSSWNRPDIEIELVCARAVILDEILSDADAAIALLDTSVDKYGAVVPLIRQQAKTVSRVGRPAEAAELMLRIEDTVGADSPLDRTLALRDAGVYSGKSGHFDDAVRQFSKAYEAIRSDDTYRPFAAALLVEKALGLWRAGSKPDAMVIAGQALDAVNEFLPSTSRQAERSHQYARGIVGLMFKEAGASEEPFDPPFTFGGASSLESESTALMGVDLKSIADNWRVLAAAEAALGIDAGIDALSMSRQDGALHFNLETGVRLARYGAALKSGDAYAVLKVAKELAILSAEAAHRKDDSQPEQRINIQQMTRLLGQPLSGSDAEITMGENAVVDVILAAALADMLDGHFLDDLRKSTAASFGTISSIEAIIKAASGNHAIGPSVPRNVMLVGGIALKEKRVSDDPGLRLYQDVTILHHLLASFGKDILLPRAIRRIIDGWKKVWDHQRFRLTQSGLHEEAITNALEEALKTHSLAATGKLLTQMSAVTNHQLAEGWFTVLSTSA